MTDEELKAIEERAAVATPGPWTNTFVNDLLHYGNVIGDVPTKTVLAEVAYYKENDAPFIAHAREDIPALCKALREAWFARDHFANQADRFFNQTTNALDERDALKTELETIKIKANKMYKKHIDPFDSIRGEMQSHAIVWALKELGFKP